MKIVKKWRENCKLFLTQSPKVLSYSVYLRFKQIHETQSNVIFECGVWIVHVREFRSISSSSILSLDLILSDEIPRRFSACRLPGLDVIDDSFSSIFRVYLLFVHRYFRGPKALCPLKMLSSMKVTNRLLRVINAQII